jgi:hypothetical protein
LNQVFCVVMNDHVYVPFVVIKVEPSILCGNEWSWICFLSRSHSWTKYSVWLWLRQTKHIHDHSLQHRIFGSTMTTTNETYPWSFITTQNTWFKHDYDKRSISMIIPLPHRILGSTMTRTNGKFEPSIMCGNEWSWICFVCRSQGWTKYSVW